MPEPLPYLQLGTDFLESEEVDAYEVASGGEGEPWDLVRLWLWLGRHRPNGDITGLGPILLAKRAGWSGDPEAFLDVLEAAGLLVTETFQLDPEDDPVEVRRFVGWGKRYDPALRKRRRDRTRARERRRDIATTRRDVATSRGHRGEERRGEESRDTPREAVKPAEPAAVPSEILQGAYDALSPTAAAKSAPLLTGLCEAHRLAFENKRARSPTSKDATHLRALLRDEKRSPSDVAKALIGMSRDPWEGRREHNRWEHLRRDFDKYLGWFDRRPTPPPTPTPARTKFRRRGVEPPPEDQHGNAITLSGYAWDERDENLLDRGYHWTGSGWAEQPGASP